MTIQVIDANGATQTIFTPNEVAAAIVAALALVTVDGTVELGSTSLTALETIELGATTLAALETINANVAGSATAANQATLIGHVDGLEASSAAILAKLIAAPATEAKQDTAIAATQALAPLSAIVAVTPSGSAFAVSRALIASADMTADLTVGGVDINGVVLNRGINPIAATKVRAVTGGTVMRAN